NLGEVVANSSDKASLHITTDLQAFGLIVTAEPYAAVRQPSDVVVLENEIRPDTVGQIEPISAKYQLLPRGNYTYNVPADLKAAEGQGPSVSMKQYEAIMEVYQAQNAVQIAQAAGADRYSADTLQKAQTELRNAQQLRDSKADRSQVVMMAREAAETAEDARIIAVKQKQQDEVARVKAQAALEQQRRVAAEQAARTAQIQADADRMQLQQDRVKLNQERAALQEARDQAAEATLAASQPPPPPPPQTVPPPNDDARQKALRASLLAELQNCGLPAIDSPRGLVVTVTSLNGASDRLARVGSILASQRGLTVEVSGNSDVDGPDAERMWRQRADEVRESLIRAGVAPQSISTRYDGASHPLASNATARGREQNRRVEITLTGGSIGNQADWDHSYSLRPRQQ
ncbi:MAG TPA: OmpA family protein, partial [Candidatus Sulfopaludibacter sp.]|nr:OmpA family protein [Candidatus Sulfopaludibacter sp.]